MTEASVNECVTKIHHTMSTFFAHKFFPKTQQIIETNQEAAEFASLNYGIDAAKLWGNEYKFPTKILDYNAELFKQSGYDLTSMIIGRRHEFQPTRMSAERVNSLSINNSERELRYDLAEGIRVPIPEEFQQYANLALTHLRSTYIKVHTTGKRLMGDLIEKGLAFVIPKDIVIKHITNLHIAKAH